MATYVKFDAFVEAVAEGVHNLGADTLTIALTAAANAPVAANSVLADLTQIAYTNLSSRVITTTSSSQTSGVYRLIIEDLTITASGGAAATFRYIVVYNDSAVSDNLVGFFDRGSNVTLGDGESLTLDFDQTNGLLSLT